jgi:hypothetical protein
MLPNDDLDLQVSNLQILMQHGFPVCRYHLGDTWRYYNRCSLPDEYGIARANYEKHLRAPLSGTYNNRFHGGMGSAIRSELWACLAPGDPALAAQMAREDACVDHADDGILAEVFLAAMESAAFCEEDVRRIVETALNANATTVVLAHNHPSGIALPSSDDVQTTHRVAAALDTVDIILADHIIVADDDFVSLVQSGVYRPVQGGFRR